MVSSQAKREHEGAEGLVRAFRLTFYAVWMEAKDDKTTTNLLRLKRFLNPKDPTFSNVFLRAIGNKRIRTNSIVCLVLGLLERCLRRDLWLVSWQVLVHLPLAAQ